MRTPLLATDMFWAPKCRGVVVSVWRIVGTEFLVKEMINTCLILLRFLSTIEGYGCTQRRRFRMQMTEARWALPVEDKRRILAESDLVRRQLRSLVEHQLHWWLSGARLADALVLDQSPASHELQAVAVLDKCAFPSLR